MNRSPQVSEWSLRRRELRAVRSSMSGALPFCIAVILFGGGVLSAGDSSLKLSLQNNDFLVGDVKDSDKSGSLRFQSPMFCSPFEFPVEGIQKLEFPENKPSEDRDRDYSFELSGGDVLFGKLISLSPDAMEIDSSGFGRLHLETSRLRRIARGAVSYTHLTLPTPPYV